MNKVLENIKTRRSVRSFTDQQISKEDLALIAEAAKWAPSGMNRQTYRFTVLTNQELIKELAWVIAKAIDRDPQTYNFYQPNALILASEPEENSNGLANCACALENMFLMANELGIGSCWINQLKLICDEKAVRAVLNKLNIPADHTVYGMAALGYAKESVTMSEEERTAVIEFVE